MSEGLNLKHLRTANSIRSDEWNNHKLTEQEKLGDLLFRTTELAGEVGEACNEVKKLFRFLGGMKGGKSIDECREALTEEIADVVICADRVAEAMNIDLSEAVISKFNKTSEKYDLSIKMNNKGVSDAR